MADDRTESELPENQACDSAPPPSPLSPTLTFPRVSADPTHGYPASTNEHLTARQSADESRASQVRSQQCIKVEGYTALRQLGIGTYGTVWLAEHDTSKKKVAVKFFNQAATTDWQILQAEVSQLAALHADPGIVELIDANVHSAQPYFIMRYCEGGSLAQRLENGPLPVDEALPLFRQICEALAYVHVKGIRHCDLKPGNILLDARGKALIGDFGQAHLSDDASPALGTFFFMAPDQADLARHLPDTRWDVYALGALLYTMLTGRPPRDDGTLRVALQTTAILAHRLALYRIKIATASRPNKHRSVSGVDRDLAALIDRCLNIDPERRPRDAGDVLRLLDRRERRRRQKPIFVAAILAPVVLVAMMCAVSVILFNSARDQANRANQDAAKKMLARNEYIAELVAADARDKIRERIDLLKQAIDDSPQLPELLQAADKLEGVDLDPALQKWLEGIDHKRPDGHGLAAAVVIWDYLWVTRLDGRIIAIRGVDTVPDLSRIRGQDFRYRDWFNGHGEKKAGEIWPILNHPYVSEPYRSKLNEQPMLVAVSVPIKAANKKDVVGLMTLTVRIDRLNEWFERLNTPDGFAVLFNQRGQYLIHPQRDKFSDFEGKKVAPTVPADFPPRLALRASPRVGQIEKPFSDPLYSNKLYMSSQASVRLPEADVDWGVAIQIAYELEDPAVQPMRETFWTTAVIGAILLGVLLPSLWLWLIRVLRRQDGLAHG